MANVWKALTRQKRYEANELTETRMARVLSMFDLTALGVGSTLGVGVYVLAGQVAKETAGPAVILSFLIAAVASVFAGLCYAEFGARVPKAGSAYVYSYVCVGEVVAFVIGWNLILEYAIGSASVARSISLYIDQLFNNTMQRHFREIAPINVEYMSSYFDFFAFGVTILLTVGLSIGVKESSFVNNIFTALNIFVVLFVIIAGSFKTDIHNWELKPSNTTANAGAGGFFPFGIGGMVKGAATCFYGFVGFDCIATSSEEVRDPKRAIPASIIASLFIIFLAYFGTSTIITLMVPYYLQDSNAPLPHAFEVIGWNSAKWIVTIGGIFGLFASLFGGLFPLPRVIYAMASDGLIFKFMGNINARFHTPLVGTVIAGILTGLMAALFDLTQLVKMMSIGTLLAYSIVAACVLLLRYSVDQSGDYTLIQSSESESEEYEENEKALSEEETTVESISLGALLSQSFNSQKHSRPTKISNRLVTYEIVAYWCLCFIFGGSILFSFDSIENGRTWSIVLTSSIGGIMILILMSIGSQPNSTTELAFKVPLVPLVPALSILMNAYLMLMLDPHTWIRFAVWMTIGSVIYIFYGIPNSIRSIQQYEALN